MMKKVIFPEDMIGDGSKPFQRLMALLPVKDRSDIKLKRFLVFRLKIDGEEATRAFLLKGLERAKENAFSGTLYEYLVDQEEALSGEIADNSLPDEPG
jgi:hypothetical protein